MTLHKPKPKPENKQRAYWRERRRQMRRWERRQRRRQLRQNNRRRLASRRTNLTSYRNSRPSASRTIQRQLSPRIPPIGSGSSYRELKAPPTEVRPAPNSVKATPTSNTGVNKNSPGKVSATIAIKVKHNRNLTPAELGPNFRKGSAAKVKSQADSVRGHAVAAKREKARRPWLIDTRFRRYKRRRRMRRPRRQRINRSRARSSSMISYRSSSSSSSGIDLSSARYGGNQTVSVRPTVLSGRQLRRGTTERQQRRGTTAYYDKLQLFDILEKKQ